MRELSLGEYLDIYVGEFDLNIYVHCAGQYRVEVELRGVDEYVDIAETLYMSCDGYSAILSGLELIVERAAAFGYEKIILGNTNEPYLAAWIYDRNNSRSEWEDFVLYIESTSDLLARNKYYLDGLRIENLHCVSNGLKPPEVLTVMPVEYAKAIYCEE